jgi:signal transduction histidine kinase
MIGRDITHAVEAAITRRKLEERLAHGQRLETIGQLTGGIAHDFNNILSASLVSAQILLDDLGPNDPRRIDAQEICDSLKRGAALTRQLLAFSRNQVFELVDVELGDVVQSISKMLRRVIGAGIDLGITPRSKGLIHADVMQLEQVIVNLVVNARDAMNKSGELRIATDDVRVEDGADVPAGDYVMLSVSDTGCGMSEETMRRLFEPFYTTKPRGCGTGLGLSTSYGIVKQLGGDIVVASEVGRGTTMKVYLPRK